METKFQTSFIPKKPITSSIQSEPESGHGVSLLMTIGMFIFIVSLLVAGGAYGLTLYLASQKTSYVKTLTTQMAQFQTDDLKRFKIMNTKIDLAKQLLSQHILTSYIFDDVGNLISDKVRFTSMDISAPDVGKPITIHITGYGLNYEVVAWQSDVLGMLEQKGLRDVVLSPVITNPAKNSTNGTVSFDFTATINPSKISYEVTAPAASSAASTTATTTDSNP